MSDFLDQCRDHVDRLKLVRHTPGGPTVDLPFGTEPEDLLNPTTFGQVYDALIISRRWADLKEGVRARHAASLMPFLREWHDFNRVGGFPVDPVVDYLTGKTMAHPYRPFKEGRRIAQKATAWAFFVRWARDIGALRGPVLGNQAEAERLFAACGFKLGLGKKAKTDDIQPVKVATTQAGEKVRFVSSVDDTLDVPNFFGSGAAHFRLRHWLPYDLTVDGALIGDGLPRDVLALDPKMRDQIEQSVKGWKHQAFFGQAHEGEPLSVRKAAMRFPKLEDIPGGPKPINMTLDQGYDPSAGHDFLAKALDRARVATPEDQPAKTIKIDLTGTGASSFGGIVKAMEDHAEKMKTIGFDAPGRDAFKDRVDGIVGRFKEAFKDTPRIRMVDPDEYWRDGVLRRISKTRRKLTKRLAKFDKLAAAIAKERARLIKKIDKADRERLRVIEQMERKLK